MPIVGVARVVSAAPNLALALGYDVAEVFEAVGGDSGSNETNTKRSENGSRDRRQMSDTALDELGPVDYMVVEFPAGASNFTGEMAAELLALVDAGTIRVIDILILTKNEDGRSTRWSSPTSGSWRAAGTRGQAGRAAGRGGRRAPRRGDGAGKHCRRAHLGEPVGCAVRVGGPTSGGQLIANGRIPIQAIIASIEADEAITEGD